MRNRHLVLRQLQRTARPTRSLVESDRLQIAVGAGGSAARSSDASMRTRSATPARSRISSAGARTLTSRSSIPSASRASTQLAERVGGLDVELGRLGQVEHDGRRRRLGVRQGEDALLDRVGVGVEERAVAAHDHHAGGRLPVRVALGPAPGPGRRVAGEHADVRAGTAAARRRRATARPRRSGPAARRARARRRARWPAKTTALRRMRAKRRSSPTRKKPATATTTIAPSAACGRSWNSGARKAPVSRIRPAAISAASCERPPAPSAAAVWLAPPDCTKPDDRPASRLAAPSPTRSRFGSTR